MRLRSIIGLLVLGIVFLASQPVSAQPLRDELPPPPAETAKEAGFLGLFANEAEAPAKGVAVVSVHPGGPADAAGLKAGDLISSIDGVGVAGIEDLAKAVEGAPVGKKLKFEITRGGKRSAHVVTLSKRPAVPPKPEAGDLPLDPAGRPVPEGGGPLDPASRASLGVRLLPLTEENRRRYSITVRSGAVIEAIREGSTADKFGLPLGGVIVSFDGRRIDSPDDVIAALRGARPGDEIELGYYQGERMFRKLIRLSPNVAAPAEAPTTDPGVKLPTIPGLGDRPAVKKLEGLLDRLIPPPAGAGGAGAPAEVPLPVDRREVIELRSEIELLKGDLARMQRKIVELEARLAAEKK